MVIKNRQEFFMKRIRNQLIMALSILCLLVWIQGNVTYAEESFLEELSQTVSGDTLDLTCKAAVLMEA